MFLLVRGLGQGGFFTYDSNDLKEQNMCLYLYRKRNNYWSNTTGREEKKKPVVYDSIINNTLKEVLNLEIHIILIQDIRSVTVEKRLIFCNPYTPALQFSQLLRPVLSLSLSFFYYRHFYFLKMVSIPRYFRHVVKSYRTL